MRSRTTTNIEVLATFGNVAITLLMLRLAMVLRQVLPYGKPLVRGDEVIPPLLYVIVAVIWLVALLFGKPRIVRTSSTIDLLWRLVATIGVASLIFAGTLFLSFRDISRIFFIYFVILDMVALILFTVAMRALLHQRQQREGLGTRVLIAGTGLSGRRLLAALDRQPGSPRVAGFLDTDPYRIGEIEGRPILGALEDAQAVISANQIDEIIIALPLDAHPRVVNLVRQLQSMPVYIRVVPDFLDFAVLRSSVDYLEGLPIVGLRVPALSYEARIAKRLFDVVVSALLLLALGPFMLLVALMIRRDTIGPAIYRAERVGENGKLFKMYKFRTMVDGAEAQFEQVALRDSNGRLSFKRPGDPRVTRVGRWLRRTSLDELPQLINVLKGDMSLVGPRPEMPIIVNQEYEPWQWSRFTVPQGMTGWWQIKRRGYEHQHLCTADDLYYIQNYSLLLDIRILLRTIQVVLSGKGAY